MSTAPAARDDWSSGHDVTRLLVDWSQGDRRALEELLPLVYDELRRLAAAYLRRERDLPTLQSTALVHEAFLRLLNQRDSTWRGRAHFFGIAAKMIRRVLVDHARARKTARRGSGAARLELNESIGASQQKDLDLIALDHALERLAQMDERQSRVVELRFFAGLSVEDTARIMGISTATVKREWASARAWLFREIARECPVS